MLARWLFVTDLHKRYADMKTIKGILPVQHEIQHDIITFCKNAGITHIGIAGDWYDKGFHGLGKAYSAMEEDRLLSRCVDGNVYLCLGNHFFLERDENPEMYIIQPCEYVKPRDLLQLAEEPVFKVVPKIKIGTVQINFFHFSKTNKNYVAPRDPDTTFNIGVYHDDRCVPGWVREREGFGVGSTSTEMMSIYSDIDLAIHGHIHSDIGLTSIQLPNGKKVPLWIPGALGMTQDKESIKHPSVNLPIIEIADDSTVTLKQATFSTHLDKLQFFSATKKSPITKALSELSGSDLVKVSAPSLSIYLQRCGYSPRQLKLVEEAREGRLDLISAVRIVSGGADEDG